MTGKLKRVGSPAKVEPIAKTIKADVSRKETNSSKQTPFQRLQHLLASRQTAGSAGQVVTSVEELQQLLLNQQSLKGVTLKFKLVWISDHLYRQTKFVRQHFTDAASPETLEAQLAVRTIWDMDSTDPVLPPPGTIAEIAYFSSMKLFREKQCQACVKLKDISRKGAQP
ncbi:hypothetical protein PF004_g16786 [Phytophthora fragariae]|uniref:Uncharacterized protein n=1 Tax=Phytophthora fragariae TaxID=53985 RepID=A0A6G0NHD5_9STRA|nr:hypothetical protein PF004_g16786 [Phytophthora fragariae]